MAESKLTWNTNLYNKKHSFVYEYGKELIDLLNPESQERILDLGCGSGELTNLIHQVSENVIGIDTSVEMISRASISFPQIQFLVADAANFLLDQKFDAIFSNAALHWVTDYKAAIQCMHTNLREGGRIVLEFGGKGNVQNIIQQIRTSLLKRNLVEHAKFDFWYFPSIGEYATDLEKEGFRVILAQHFDRPTELADVNNGISDWITMFGHHFFQDLPNHISEEIKTEVQEQLRPTSFLNGKWFADYKRIRIIAIKEAIVQNKRT